MDYHWFLNFSSSRKVSKILGWIVTATDLISRWDEKSMKGASDKACQDCLIDYDWYPKLANSPNFEDLAIL